MGAFVRLFFRSIAVLAAVLVFVPSASASFHLWRIEQIYSNADGTVQFVVLHDDFNGEQFLTGHTLKATHAGATNSFTFPHDLPSSATAGRRMLIATQGFAALGIVTPDYEIPNGFLATGSGALNFADVDTVGYGALPTDGVTAINRSGTAIPNVATNFAGQSASVSLAGPPAVFGNVQGLWWNDPDESERGWGINLNHQGDTIFGTWFTFGLGGQPLWLVVTATSTPATPNVFSGNLLSFSGSRFDAFDETKVVSAPAGTATFSFSDRDHATFDYTVAGVPQTKHIKREPLNASPMASCSWGSQPNLALATNYQDLWYAFPADSEKGWGINFTHQGDTIFATWFTYGTDGQPAWLVVALTNTPAQPKVFTGALNKALSGPPFNANPFNFGALQFQSEGVATVTFQDGNFATFDYSVDGVAQSKQITRDVFAPPGTVCQ